MKLPGWLRQWGARFLAWRSDEIGGMLHDYANGKWILLATWNTQKESDAAIEIVDNMMNCGRDSIFIAMIKVGPSQGYFIVEDSNRSKFYLRGFWQGIYEPDEAFRDVRNYCRKLADKMGFRRPDADA